MNRFDTSNPYDADKARACLERLIEKGHKIEIKTVQPPKRTSRQNRFMHALFALVSDETGISKEVVKQKLFKRDLNKDIFFIDETVVGEFVFSNYRSVASLTKEEAILSINRLIFFMTSELGMYVPDPTEYLSNEDSKDFNIENFIFYAEKRDAENAQYNI